MLDKEFLKSHCALSTSISSEADVTLRDDLGNHSMQASNLVFADVGGQYSSLSQNSNESDLFGDLK